MTALGEAVTRQVLEEARRAAGGGAALAAALQVFDSVDSNGIPRGDGEEIVCGYDDGADDCVIEAESDGELTRLKVYSNRLTTGLGTIQMTWLRLAGEDVQEVWSSWGARVGGTDDQS